MLPFDADAFAAHLQEWFVRSGRDLPWRQTSDPYAIWISESMLQQTQVSAVIGYYSRWLKALPTVEKLASASEEVVLRLWEGLGYYSRARNLRRAAGEICEKWGGKIPSDPKELVKLPGVGRYTAGAIAAFAFDLPVPVVDTNIARVLARVFEFEQPLDSPAAQEVIWRYSSELVAGRSGRLFTSAIMELGALICTPRKPQCLICPVKAFCAAKNPESLPVRRKNPEITRLEEYRAVWIKDGHLFLRLSTGPRWIGMWMFPELPAAPGAQADWSLEYSVTRYRMTLLAFRAEFFGQEDGSWFGEETIQSLPMPAPHRRLVELVFA